MARHARLRLFVLVIPATLCGSPRGESAHQDADFRFVLNAMRNERLKIQSGLCRINGQFTLVNPADPNRDVEGPLTILAAFEGQDRIRFDREQPGWVIDRETVRAVPGGQPGQAAADSKRGMEKYKFYDDGRKAAFWSEEEPQINVMASLANKRNPFLRLGYFDVRGLGMYHYFALQRQNRFNELFDGYARMTAQALVDRTDASLWLVKSVETDGPMESELSISVDVRNGFTPVKYAMRVRNIKLKEDWYTGEERTTKWEKQNDVWVPISHSYFFSPSKGAWREQVTFTIAWEKLNESIDPAYFDWEDFGARDRVGIVDTSLGSPITVRPIGTPAPATSRLRAPFIVTLAVGLAAIAAGLVVLFKRRRRTAAS